MIGDKPRFAAPQGDSIVPPWRVRLRREARFQKEPDRDPDRRMSFSGPQLRFATGPLSPDRMSGQKPDLEIVENIKSVSSAHNRTLAAFRGIPTPCIASKASMPASARCRDRSRLGRRLEVAERETRGTGASCIRRRRRQCCSVGSVDSHRSSLAPCSRRTIARASGARSPFMVNAA